MTQVILCASYPNLGSSPSMVMDTVHGSRSGLSKSEKYLGHLNAPGLRTDTGPLTAKVMFVSGQFLKHHFR